LKRENIKNECVCVVGSGPTGVVAALTLVQAGIPVVMLESGSHFPRRLHLRVGGIDLLRPTPPTLREPVADVDFVNHGDGHARWIKAHCLGGLSNYWSGITLRYSKGDFTDGERLHGMYRWPICYKDLAPYYERAERLIQIRGGKEDHETLPACAVAYERPIGREWKRFGNICNDRGRALVVLPDAYGPSTIVSSLGTPQNFALRVLESLKQSDRFHLITHAHVTRVLMHPHTAKARAVEYVDTRTGVCDTQRAKAVVLAAGPLSSTQILLNSKSGSFPDGLGNSQGVLGRYLHDHPLHYSQVEGDFRFRRLDDRRRGGLYVTRERYAGSAPLRAAACLIYGGTIFSMLPSLLLLRHRHYFKVLKRMLVARRSSAGAPARGLPALSDSLMYVCCFGTQIPRPENLVCLDPDKKDPHGVPLLQLNTRFSDSEQEYVQEAGRFVPAVLEETGARVRRVTSELQAGGTSVHYGGTVRMHESPQYGVLDKWNRVHEIPNVLVVDASSFTTCVEKNPSLTAVAISMRGAERLALEGLT
jgi:choline dehydrogenase-like flavoprotein